VTQVSTRLKDRGLVSPLNSYSALEGGHVCLTVDSARDRGARVTVSAITLTEALRGGPRDAAVHRVLSRITVVPVMAAIARRAGELLGATGLPGHQCAIDAAVAATALEMGRPVLLLTSDPDDLTKLTGEPGRPKAQRIAVVHV
jgi:predicted nucleic acid-binding protein